MLFRAMSIYRIKSSLLGHYFLWLIAIVFTLFFNHQANSQAFRNEWINYNKTYFRFIVTPTVPITATSNTHHTPADFQMLHRISYTTLAANGLAGNPVEQFQLWRNGQEVAMYTYPASGMMGSDGYLEFWGQPNDGLPDTELFRYSNSQTNNRWSMFSDTAYYYLTTNTSGTNKRYANAANNVAGNTLTPDSFFMHTIRVNPHGTRNLGYATNIIGTEVRSSTFEDGEGWGEGRFAGSGFSLPLGKLFANTTAPATITLKVCLQTFANASKRFELYLNNDSIYVKSFARYASDSATKTSIPLSYITTNDSTNILVRAETLDNSYRYLINKILFTYPRKFEFNKTTSTFLFELPASAQGNLLKIVNFDTSAADKILLDQTNSKRYLGVRTGDTLWFALPAAASTRSFILTTLDATPSRNLVKEITSLTAKTFTNFTTPALQGDYIIISNSRLTNYNGSNPVENYRAYRSSAAGGSFNAKVYDIDELTEQFAFGVRKSPLAIRNFLRYARSNFSIPLKYVLLLGRGATYNYSITEPNADALNLVPTWGHPASDNLLSSADNNTITPVTPIGRIGAINGEEVMDYLDKLIAFENISNSQTDNKAWQKQTLHLVGGNDAGIVVPLTTYMQNYEAKIKDTLVGADVKTFFRLNNPNTSANLENIKSTIKNGAGLISYFGHSSATALDFNLNKPEELEYTAGRLPVFIANGCNAAEYFDVNPKRFNQAQLTLSERFVLAKNKGSIAFISSTHYGVMQYLDYFTSKWYNVLSTTKYQKSIGEIQKESIQQFLDYTSLSDRTGRLTAEEYNLQGDPAIKIHTQTKPDYYADSAEVIITPTKATAGNDSMYISATLRNGGMALNDTLSIKFSHLTPNGNEIIILDTFAVSLNASKIFTFKLPVNGRINNGLNKLRIYLDGNNKLDETNETNNISDRTFVIHPNGLEPILPLNYSIVNQWPVPLIASAFDILADSAQFRMEMDTTELFNSPLKYTQEINAKGGNIRFTPANTLLPGKVYYWRTARLDGGLPSEWSTASFSYLPDDSAGFRQGHYFQHTYSGFDRIMLDAPSRKFKFTNKGNNIYISHGIYGYSGSYDNDFSVTPNGITNIVSACVGKSIIFNVFDSISFKPLTNLNQAYGSGPYCSPGREYNFEFSATPTSNRKKIMDFIDSIPSGYYVVARLVVDPPHDSLTAANWLKDTAVFGAGKSLYHSLKKQGFSGLDDLTAGKTFGFVFKKNDTLSYKPTFTITNGLYDMAVLSTDLPMTDTTSNLSSPWFGPSVRWDGLHWQNDGSTEPNGIESDSAWINVVGKKQNGQIDTLFTFGKQVGDIAFVNANSIDAATYPYLRLVLHTDDSDNGTPYPLANWKVNFQPAPEGAFVPEEYFSFTTKPNSTDFKETLVIGSDSLKIAVAFRNISNVNYTDSLQALIQLKDEWGQVHTLLEKKMRPLAAGDSLVLHYDEPMDSAYGKCSLYIGINAANQQPEVTVNNNFFYYNFNTTLAINDGEKIFTGTGNWSDPLRWSPPGVPDCDDKVFIAGDCNVDLSNAVSDSLTIMKNGRLKLAQNISNLNVGCNDEGGNELLLVKGILEISNGVLQINGGLVFADSSIFRQHGGNIYVDGNNGITGESLNLATPGDIGHTLPAGIISFGGINTTPGSTMEPFQHGILEITGGNLTVVDPPITGLGYSVFISNGGTNPLAFAKNHNLIIGGLNNAAINPVSESNSLVLHIEQAGNTNALALGALVVHTASVPNRKAIISAQAGSTIRVLGPIVLYQNGNFKINTDLQIILEQ